jgi:hypothetical protein
MVPEHETAKLICRRAERFIEGFSTKTELITLYNEFFGDRGLIEHTGLRVAYENMKQKIISNHLIGLVLIGLEEGMNDIFITNYTAMNFQAMDYVVIKLTVGSISKSVIEDFFTEEEIIELCKAMPNYDVYKGCVNNSTENSEGQL